MDPKRWRSTFSDLQEAVVTVIGDHYGLYGRLLDFQTSLYDLGADEVDYLEVLMTLEELLEYPLLPLPANPPETIGEIISYCETAENDSLLGRKNDED